MSKRRSLVDMHRTLTKATTAAPATSGKPSAIGKGVVTAIHLPPDVLALLRRVAVERAIQAGGGRPSVSALLVELVERHRAELEAELRGRS